FPMLIGGTLDAPILDNRRTRIGVVQDGTVRERHGDADPSLVLARDLLRGRVPDGEALRARISGGMPVMSPEFREGRVDLTVVRELAWLEEQIAAAFADDRHLIAVGLLRAARQRGADPFRTGLQLADSLYRV